MYKVEIDRVFELAADRELDYETREKVRGIIVKNLKNAADSHMIIKSKEDADLFRKKFVSQAELFYKYAEFEHGGNKEEKELAGKISQVITRIMNEQKEKDIIFIDKILLSDLSEDVRALFENEYVTEIKEN